MPVHRINRKQHRAQLTTLGTHQPHCRPPFQLPIEAMTNRVDHSRDLSPFEPSQQLELSQIDRQSMDVIDEPLTQDEQSNAELSLLEDAVDGNVHENSYSQLWANSQPAKLGLLHIDEWDEEKTYDEEPPSCIHYSIEWKVTVNNKPISKDTEQNLVLAPSFYWPLILRPKLEKLLRKKVPSNKRVMPDDTSVVVSVTGRSERDLTKRFDEIEIDWPVIEKQLVAWGELFRAGKRLRVDISFNYLETGQPLPASSRRGDKRGFSSATQQMRTEGAMQLDAEEESSRQPSIWRDVYNLMRCPGPPCDLGPHCWRDPAGKKHYKLKTHHLKGLIRHVQHGGQLRTHDDVPEDIRQQLYREEQQQHERHQRATNVSSSNVPPINITNVLPGPSHQHFLSTPLMATTASKAPLVTPLVIPGPRDIAVQEYSNWQKSQVRSQTLQAEFQKACDVALTHGFDLEQIHEDRDPGFFTNKGVIEGIARRFVNDIQHWVEQYKCSPRMEDSD